MDTNEILEQIDESFAKVTNQVNQTLIDIDGETHLPLWIQKYVNAPTFSISADTLQGIKIGLRIARWKIQNIWNKENTNGKEGKENLISS